MVTLDQAKALEYGQIIYSLHYTNCDGSAQRWRVNGRPKVWKTRPDEVRVPLKRGLYEFGYLTELDLDDYSLVEPVKISLIQIDTVFSAAQRQDDYVIGLYQLAYEGYWDNVLRVKGWPEIDAKTNNYIWKKAIEFDRVHHPDCIAGGAWMNNGFSTTKSLPEGTIIPAPVEYVA